MTSTIRIARKPFSEALSMAARLCSARTTMPILNHILIRSESDKTITVAATDLVSSIRVKVPIDGAGSLLGAPTSLCLSRSAAAIAAGMAGQSLDIDPPDQHKPKGVASFRAGTSRYDVPCLLARDFPKLQDEPKTWAAVPAEALLEIVTSVSMTASKDATRAHLSGVLFELDTAQAKIRAVATDGHRLSVMVSPVLETAAIKSLTVALGARGKDGMLVPIGSIGTMTQAISSAGSDPIEIGVQGAHLFLRHKNLTTSIQLNDAAFPPYAQVMPKNLAMRVKIDRKELLRIVSLFMAARGEDKVKGCRIEVRPGDSLVVFSFDSPDSGSGTEQVSCDVLERDGDKKCVFGLDLNYVKAALNCVRTSAVILAGSGELDPVVVEEEYETKTKGAVPDYLCVIMPMRL